MARKRSSNKPKRIAIAIELDFPFPHHYDCCRGIQRYAAERGWLTVIDPHLVGMTGQAGPAEYDGVVGRITSQAAEAARAHGDGSGGQSGLLHGAFWPWIRKENMQNVD
jgi:hypothetical protein